MASAETVLLKSTLEIQGKAYSVKLTSSEIYWEVITSTRVTGGPYSEPLVKTENQTVKLSDIIAVKLGNREAEYDKKFRQMEMVSLHPTMFCVWVIRPCQRHKWRERKVMFHSRDSSVVQQWVEKIHEILEQPEMNRPRSLLVFINPISGRRHAPKIYQEKIAPIFELAGISADIVTTQRQGHARDTLLDYDLSRIDGVVCVGGDGLFMELVHGLLNRTLADKTGSSNPTPNSALFQPSVRIGIIPAGSTDTVAHTIYGTCDPFSSAVHIILGDHMSMDVGAVFHGNQFSRYNVSMLGYGYYGDCLAGSERNRWMGPRRYDWEGFKKVLGLRVYEGEISYVPSDDRENHPRDGTTCKVGCSVCSSVDVQDIDITESETVQDTEKPVLKIRGRFVAISSFLISCRCRYSPEGPSPAAHLGDGNTDLLIVKECSRADYIRHLYRCSKRNSDQFNFNFIQVIRVKEFQFRPLVDEIDDTTETSDGKMASQQRLRSRVSHNSVWNCDGEVIEDPSVDFKVHRQIIRLFARGIEDGPKDGGSLCTACLSS